MTGATTLACFALLVSPAVEMARAMELNLHAGFLAAPQEDKTVRARATRAASLLERRAEEAGNSQLEALALRIGSATLAHGNPQNFDEVKMLLRRMIASATAAQSNDVGLHEFCASEMGKSKEGATRLGDRAEKGQADLDKLSAEADQAKQKIADLHADIAGSQKSLVAESEVRAKERTAYEQKKAELLDAESKHRDALEKISIDDSAARAVQEHTADAALQKRIKMETAEAAANLDFERKQREGKNSIRVKTEQIKHEEHALLRMKSELVENTQDLKMLNDQLAAAKLYEQQIAHKCTVPSTTHEDRAQRRENQIQSLKDAYQILNAP